MKKLLCGFVLVAVISAIYGELKRNPVPSDVLAIENVEALADNETDSEGRIICYTSFVGKDYGDKTVKDCGTCMDVDCYDYSDRSKCKK